MDWTDAKAESAKLFLKNLHDEIGDYPELFRGGKLATPLPQPSKEIVEALADDLNTHLALSEFRKRVKATDFSKRPQALQVLADGLLLGFFSGKGKPKTTVAALISKDVQEYIDHLLVERNDARSNKDFSRADRIRDHLAAADVHIIDGPDGSSSKIGPEFNPSKLEALK